MKKTWLFATALVLALALVGLGGCTPGATNEGGLPSGLKISLDNQQEGIRVSGHGEVFAAPDITILQLGISAQRTSVAEAQSEAATAMDKAMTALKEGGIASKDIQTQQFSIQQVTRWDQDKQEQVVIGYRVDNMVIAKIREIDKTGSIIDAVAVAGGDYTRIDSISFSIDDPSNYKKEARDKAMADAKAKAEQLANLSGVKLGKPTYITESIYYPVYPSPIRPGEAMPAPAAPVTSISPGEMKITLDVQVAYAISD
ncbi:SIMPL domain-containing protein [Chloroflexota bacterium]